MACVRTFHAESACSSLLLIAANGGIAAIFSEETIAIISSFSVIFDRGMFTQKLVIGLIVWTSVVMRLNDIFVSIKLRE